MSKRQILVTSALPYANGAIHLGHMVEHIQTDIWVRFQKMRGHECYYVCADDTHGTPIMLKAEKDGITPEALIARVQQEHLRDFTGFHIGYDNYYSTNSPENRAYAYDMYKKLRDAGKIVSRTIEQLFDPEKQMFLPDRFVKGECPKCGAKDQYGDNCESCGTTYSPTELKNPYSAVSGATPVLRESEHFFFKLGDCADFLKRWTAGSSPLADGREQPHLQPESLNKMNEWIEGGLQDWDISRDAPYFGFEIPDAPGKYFYVWLDAPIGYMASFRNLCDREGIDFDTFFNKDSSAELYHFIGKDILYFHALFWPATLEYSNYRTPTGVFAHGFLTVDGAKMSKSRGTFITAQSYLDCGLNPEWMRYYIAAKLNSKIEDIDLSLPDFVARVNSDLIGKFVNIASRAAGFITKRFDGRLADAIAADAELASPVCLAGEFESGAGLLRRLQQEADGIAAAYEAREYAKALRDVMALADAVNAYVDANKPWELARKEGADTELQQVCTVLINAFRLLAIYLKPVLPKLVGQVEGFLNVAPLGWADAATLLLGHAIQPYQHLMQRVEQTQIDALLEANKQSIEAAPVAAAIEPIADTIAFDDFAKLDLRVATVVACQFVDKSDKLLQFTVDLGEGRTRNIFSGIRSAYGEPATLVGRQVIVVANLAPRKMRFGVSEGMIVCASGTADDSGLFLLDVDAGAAPGMRVS